MGWTVRGSNPTRDKGVFSAQRRPEQFWGHPASYLMGTGTLFWVKQMGHEVNHLYPSGTEVKHEWNYTSTHLICLHGVYRDNFTFVLIHVH